MRAFIALPLPEAFAADAAALARRLGSSIEGRFLPRENHHLTLAFLGDIGDREVIAAAEALDAACAESCAITLRSDGLGKFGRASDATLWLGIAANPALADLAARLRDELSARNVPFDDKPFKPHVTLARRARIPKRDLPPLVFPRDDIASSVVLFKSTLERAGATYKPLHAAELPS